jgi:hypothetical protein
MQALWFEGKMVSELLVLERWSRSQSLSLGQSLSFGQSLSLGRSLSRSLFAFC